MDIRCHLVTSFYVLTMSARMRVWSSAEVGTLAGKMSFFFFQAEDGIRDIGVTGGSDVCSSDLVVLARVRRRRAGSRVPQPGRRRHRPPARRCAGHLRRDAGRRQHEAGPLAGTAGRRAGLGDRKSVAEGKSVDLGGRRIITKKNT